jgi:Mn2+/Fe2+ NRAMP family transporter
MLQVALWLRNIVTRGVAIVPSLIICLLAGTEGANTLIIASSVVLSFHLPFALIPLLKFTSAEITMGDFRNSKAVRFTRIPATSRFCCFSIYAHDSSPACDG